MGIKIPDKFKSVLAAVAPMLATAVGGPFAPLAGAIISKALGGGSDAETQAALEAQTPETLLKLKEGEKDFLLEMERLGIEKEQLVYKDIADARAREIAVRDQTPAILAYAITVGFFGTLSYLLVYGKPETGGDALLVMLGSLGTAWAGVVAYYFGSSTGSKTKDILAFLKGNK